MTQKVIEANRCYFDAVADGYDEDPAQRYGCYHANSKARYRAMLTKNLHLVRRGLTVNLGCGTGNMMDLEEQLGLRPLGVEISFRMLLKARQKGKQLRLLQGEVHRLPFPDESVSLASGFLLLHHVYDHDLFFREIHRILMPGGILFTDYDPNFYPSSLAKEHRLLSLLWKLRRMISYRVMKVGGNGIDLEIARLADYYSETVPGLKAQELSASLERTGFQNIRVIPHSDGRSLLQPQQGRLVHKGFESLLRFSGVTEYGHRAKNLAVVAQKPGPGVPAVQVA